LSTTSSGDRVIFGVVPDFCAIKVVGVVLKTAVFDVNSWLNVDEIPETGAVCSRLTDEHKSDESCSGLAGAAL